MAIFDFLSLTPKSKIGTVEIQATLEEIYTDTVQTTEHPVQLGAAITDHAYKRPAEVVIRCGWSNSTLDALLGNAKFAQFDGEMSASDYVSGVYSQLLALQNARVRFDITTSKRHYTDMLITGLQVTTDQATSNVLMVTATCRQIIIVNTQATTLPPRENQANAASTASTENAGAKQTVPAAAPPSGAVPSGNM